MKLSRRLVLLGGPAVLLALVVLVGNAVSRPSGTRAASNYTMVANDAAGTGVASFSVLIDIQQADASYMGYQYELEFDPAALAFESATDTKLGNLSLCQAPSQAGGIINGGCATAGTTQDDLGTVTIVNFHCLKNGPSSLHFRSLADDHLFGSAIIDGSGQLDPTTTLIDGTATCSGFPTPTPTRTNTPTPTNTRTETPTPAPSGTPTPSRTPTITSTPTETPIYSPTPTNTPTSTPTPGPNQDPDGDGCVTSEELSIGFNPFNYWDFYDVPVPVNLDPVPNGSRDKAVTMLDVLAVLQYAPSPPPNLTLDDRNVNGVAYNADKNGDGKPDGQDYDRSLSPPPNPPWDAGPPDLSISLLDVLTALKQVGIDCGDADGDGMPNRYERAHACLNVTVPDADQDPDNDGAANFTEYLYGTDPCNPDTDGDGMPDGYEISNSCLQPLVPDANADPDGDGLTNIQELGYGTNPCNADTDGDGMSDKYEVSNSSCLQPLVPDASADPDGDGLTNMQELGYGTNPCNADTDGDGMSDKYEVSNSCLQPLVADAGADPDGDGLTNIQEFSLGTNACNPDTDGDGCLDGLESPLGLDPLDPWDFYDVPTPARPDPIPNGIFTGYDSINVDTDEALGDVSGHTARAQSFQYPYATNVTLAVLWVKKVGSPTDQLQLEIQTDASGLPSGTVITNGTSELVSESNVGSAFGWIGFKFATPPSLTANTSYHLVLKRTGPLSASDYYVWGGDTTSPGYADGAASVFNGSAWLSETADKAFWAVAAKDKTVSLLDVLAVLRYSPSPPPGLTLDDANVNGVAYNSDKDFDGRVDGLDYDRSQSPPPNPPWDAGPPDGSISLLDVMFALHQVPLSCVSP